MSPLIALFGLGLDSLSMVYVYTAYRNRLREINIVKDAVIYDRNSDIISDLNANNTRIINYVGIIGEVRASSDLLSSRHCDDEKGVIRHNCLVEHNDEIRRGVWVTVTNVLRNRYSEVPFSLTGDQIDVEIKEPLKANFMKHDLTLTHKEYEPIHFGLNANSMARYMGSVSKVFEETEHMLHANEKLLAYGSIILNSAGQLTMNAPDDVKMPGYIITTKSRGEVIRALDESATELKWAFWAMLSIAGGLIGYLTWRVYKTVKRRRLYREMIQDVKDMAENAREHNFDYDTVESCGDVSSHTDGQHLCLVCLRNRRQVLFLPCRHVCSCAACFRLLPQPWTCMVCRASVDEILPVYLP